MQNYNTRKLTVDDLICEFLLYKTKNGYEPNFEISEFFNFLLCFNMNMDINEDFFDESKIFNCFFASNKKEVKQPVSFIDLEFNKNIKQSLVKMNYKFNDYYRSTLNTYYLNNVRDDINKVMDVFLTNNCKKRNLDEKVDVNEVELSVGKNMAKIMIMNVWINYLEKYNLYNNMKKNPFAKRETNIKSCEEMKNDLLELYYILAKRISIMYHNDKDLKISTYPSNYLAKANFDLLIKGYENLISISYGSYKKSMDIDFSTLSFNEYYILDDKYENYNRINSSINIPYNSQLNLSKN